MKPCWHKTGLQYWNCCLVPHIQKVGTLWQALNGQSNKSTWKKFSLHVFFWNLAKNCPSLGKTKDSTHLVGLSSTTLFFPLSTPKVYNLKNCVFHILLTGKRVLLMHYTEIVSKQKLQRTFFGTGQCIIIRKDYPLVLSSKHRRKYNSFLHIWVLFSVS